jgi:hypothetical protein
VENVTLAGLMIGAVSITHFLQTIIIGCENVHYIVQTAISPWTGQAMNADHLPTLLQLGQEGILSVQRPVMQHVGVASQLEYGPRSMHPTSITCSNPNQCTYYTGDQGLIAGQLCLQTPNAISAKNGNEMYVLYGPLVAID